VGLTNSFQTEFHLGGTFFSKPWENFLNPKYTPNYYKIQSFGKNVPPHKKLSKSAFFPDIPLKSTEFGGM